MAESQRYGNIGVMWPSPSFNNYEPTWEWYANRAIHKKVLALVMKRIGYEKTIGRGWMVVEHPEDHPQFKSKNSSSSFEKERERCNELSAIDEDLRLNFDEAMIFNKNYKIKLT